MLRLIKKISFIVLLIYSVNAFCEEPLAWPVEMVFHASPKKDLHEIKPINKYVFACPSIKTASCFLLRWRDDWVNLIVLDDKHYLFTADIDRLYKADVGGAIYLLPANHFQGNHDFGLGDYELVSKSAAIVLGKIEEKSAVSAMKKFGVDIYSVAQHDFEHIKKLKNLEEKVLHLIKHGKRIE